MCGSALVSKEEGFRGDRRRFLFGTAALAATALFGRYARAQEAPFSEEGTILFLRESTGMSVRNVPRADIERAVATGTANAFNWQKAKVNNLMGGPVFYGARVADSSLLVLVDGRGRFGVFEGKVPIQVVETIVPSAAPLPAPITTSLSEPPVQMQQTLSVDFSGLTSSPSLNRFRGSLPPSDERFVPARLDWDKAILRTPTPESFSSVVDRTGLYKVPYRKRDGEQRVMLVYINYLGQFFVLDFEGEHFKRPVLLQARQLREDIITPQGHRNLGFALSKDEEGYAKVAMYVMHPDLGSGYGFGFTPEARSVEKPSYVVSV